MITSANRTLQIVSIQHELAMSIGLDLKLKKMLVAFLEKAQQRLSLSCAYVFHTSDIQHYTQQHDSQLSVISFPYKDPSCERITQLEEKAVRYLGEPDGEYQQHAINHLLYHFLPIPLFGVLVLERKHKPIDEMILAAIRPLLSRLGMSCQACIQHQNLINEIKARKEIEEQMEQQSLLDSLTKLPNRKMFSMNVEKALANAHRNAKSGAIICINIDRFKTINDSLGHLAGDQVLKTLSSRLLDVVRKGDSLARIAGDEFMLLVTDLPQLESLAMTQVSVVVDKVISLASLSFDLDENDLRLSLSMGIALFSNKESSLAFEQESSLLMHNANSAMYRIKGHSRNGYCFFNKELQQQSDRRIQIEKNLKTAISNQEFELHYQPLVQKNGSIIGIEALLRWNNSELTSIGPDEFIPIAEESGLILEIGKWVIDEACRFIIELVKSGNDSALKYISINVSPKQFSQTCFVEETLAALEKYQVNPQWIRIEITEGMVIDDISSTVEKMDRLKEHGLYCMLDDFGSGYSSLSYLHQLPLKAVKIDRYFITDIDTNNKNQIIVDSIIDISENFSLDCIVEGLEREQEYLYLKGKNISAIQGYFFYKPMPGQRLLQVLADL